MIYLSLILTLMMIAVPSSAAEYLIKIGNSTSFEDGDIIHAMNDRRIKDVHAQTITHPKKCNLGPGVRHEAGCLAQVYLENTKEFKMERISENEVRRTNLATLDTDIISDVANKAGEYMDVPFFIKRRIAHHAHQIFGSNGAEYWYGGKTDASLSNLSTIWTEIESKTAFREADHTKFPFTDKELSNYYVVKVQDFTNSERGDLEAPLLDVDGNTVKARKNYVDWENDLGLTIGEIAQIKDNGIKVDHRDKTAKVGSTIGSVKI